MKLRDRGVVTLRAFSETYIEGYAKVRNKKKSWKLKETSLKGLIRFMGNVQLGAVTPRHLHNFVRKRKQGGVSNATVNWDIAAIKHLLNYAVECGLLDANPIGSFKKLKEEQKERQRFTDDQIQVVIDAVRPDCRPIFVFIRETGCRHTEALSLQHSHVVEASREVVFTEDTKSRKYRYFPLTDAAIEAVNTLPRLKTSPYVFYNLKTENRWNYCRKPWEEARKKVGLPEIRVKDLRRHYAIGLAEKGAAMHDIQQVLGHASVATTEKYYAQFSPHHSAKKILRVLQGGNGSRDGNKTETSVRIINVSGAV